MIRCTKCGEKYSKQEIAELRAEHEPMSMHPFICPDCYDRIFSMDLEDQFDALMERVS